nr:helix-turn-helix domain-containing protein [Clostridioides difficile]
MKKAYKFRMYPNKKQQELINKTFGCCRFVYNKYLAKRIEVYKNDKETFTYKQCSSDLTNLKKELKWLKEPDKFSLQNALKDLDNAYKKFFKKRQDFLNLNQRKLIDFHIKLTLQMETLCIVVNI